MRNASLCVTCFCAWLPSMKGSPRFAVSVMVCHCHCIVMRGLDPRSIPLKDVAKAMDCRVSPAMTERVGGPGRDAARSAASLNRAVRTSEFGTASALQRIATRSVRGTRLERSVTSAAYPAPTVLDICATRTCKLVCSMPKSATHPLPHTSPACAHAMLRTTALPEKISSAYASLSSPSGTSTPQPSPSMRVRLIHAMCMPSPVATARDMHRRQRLERGVAGRHRQRHRRGIVVIAARCDDAQLHRPRQRVEAARDGTMCASSSTNGAPAGSGFAIAPSLPALPAQQTRQQISAALDQHGIGELQDLPPAVGILHRRRIAAFQHPRIARSTPARRHKICTRTELARSHRAGRTGRQRIQRLADRPQAQRQPRPRSKLAPSDDCQTATEPGQGLAEIASRVSTAGAMRRASADPARSPAPARAPAASPAV